MSETLYELTEAYIKANDALEVDEDTGEVFGWEELDDISDKLEIKMENVAVMYKVAKAMSSALQIEEAHLAKRRKAYEKKAEWLEDYIKSSMMLTGIKKLEGTRAVVSFRKSDAVEILNMDEIPEEYLRKKVTITPDKVEIKKALKAGKEVSGAYLEERDNISIK